MLSSETTIGVISDTHGLLREEASVVLRDSDLIIHAGDIGKPEVLEGLREIASVVAVRGNNDKGGWASTLRDNEVVEVAGLFLYVLHDLAALDLDPAAAGFKAVIAGHSHRPKVEKRAGVVYVNPGSAGPRRFKLPVSLARVRIRVHEVEAEIIELPV